jgi:hypothetical protein
LLFHCTLFWHNTVDVTFFDSDIGHIQQQSLEEFSVFFFETVYIYSQQSWVGHLKQAICVFFAAQMVSSNRSADLSQAANTGD